MSATRRTVIGRRMPDAGLEVGVPLSHLTGKGSHLLEGPLPPRFVRQAGRISISGIGLTRTMRSIVSRFSSTLRGIESIPTARRSLNQEKERCTMSRDKMPSQSQT